MSQNAIQCRLIAPETTRRQQWQLMAEKNTPLINELLKQLAEHPELETWKRKGKIPPGTVKNLCQPLRTCPQYINQPGRFYSSVISLAEYIYRSWLKLQRRLIFRLNGQQRWLQMLKSDEELVAESGRSLKEIEAKASEALDRLNREENPSISNRLFDLYDETEDILIRSAIVYLLKNGCKIRQKPEDPKKFARRRRKTEIRVKRLQEKLNGKAPQGRDLTGEKWLNTLFTATSQVPQDEAQAKSWQDILLTKSKLVPYPIVYESNEDLTWSKNERGRLCVKFNGLSDHTFQIYCDRRQLKIFNRFYEDQQIKKASKNSHSSALFTLRSATIAWQEGKGKGEPWNVNRLILYCTFDNLLLTTEGTEVVRQEKAEAIANTLTKIKEKGDLNQKQQAFIRRKETSLSRINNPFPRPSRPLYKGKSNILLGVAIRLDKPATVAIVDGATDKAIAYLSTKQLLGKNYHLLNRKRQQQHILSHQRNVAQRHHANNKFGESELGQYIDRLLAKAIIQLAKDYRVGSIVVPYMEDTREIIQAEVQARAEAKIPGCIEKQKEYAKKYRTNIHKWSYGRLIDLIKAQAAKAGIVIEESKQSIRGDPKKQAKEIAVCAYRDRIVPF
ncbi:type V CRISPR-associated protein Cas12k [Myxosarcina sp. GI1]|uniref:type V CRISPR-associated protein Cas12k n=1 Tax=Myxosarcina sp. GI1 TaxID=1541065 RepID=UPI00056BF600|nr:type V CRISPR-associated protein Cas12k [Myxosarcina sp. GI1]